MISGPCYVDKTLIPVSETGGERVMTAANGLGSRCDLLRSLHRSGVPVVLPNAWDAATAKAVAAAGFPAVATTSAGVAAVPGYQDHEGAPAGEMLAAAVRITRSVGVPVTVDAEAGYGMTAAELVAEPKGMGAAGCNLEDTNHAALALHDPARQAAWLRDVCQAASGLGYPLVINARIDVFLPSAVPGSGGPAQGELMLEALRRAGIPGGRCRLRVPDRAVGGRCAGGLRFEVPGPGQRAPLPANPSLAELAELGVARVSYGGLLHRDVMEQFGRALASLPAEREHLPTG